MPRTLDIHTGETQMRHEYRCACGNVFPLDREHYNKQAQVFADYFRDELKIKIVSAYLATCDCGSDHTIITSHQNPQLTNPPTK
jgi:hypothetical protein